ncbi:MAG: sigma-70 family RNA polymerase sigma factor [Gemmatimonadota bacterium]|nr:sigma-70 family RNA polymerase sigma factor [Gemmatimonadota bacterium]
MSGDGSFDAAFRAVFDDRFAALFRYLDRLSGDPALAADVAQDAFIKLYRRGAMPENVGAWLVSVASNSFRDERRKVSRRLRLLARRAPDATLADAPPAPDANLASEEQRRAARAALDQMSERDRQLLLLRQEGYSYHELAVALGIHQSSVGTLIRRATATFRAAAEGGQRASE